MKKYAFGVDIGVQPVRLDFLTQTEHWLDKWEIKTNTENNG